MSEEVILANSISIREAGFDETWLQDQICDNPNILGLGDLETISRERRQSTGGRIDILLKNPEDDSMYEVEVMLGETDETHIVRTIEYWDLEKRKWPQRQHFAVLVAESITRRFYNVIHILSNAIPVIAIQVALVEVGDKKSLFFTKVLDTFEELEDGSSLNNDTYDEKYWIEKADWTLEATKTLFDIVKDVLPDKSLNYVKNYISVSVFGYNYFWLHKRSAQKSLLGFKIDQNYSDEVAELLDERNLSYVKKPKSIRMTLDKEVIEENADLFKEIANYIKNSMGH